MNQMFIADIFSLSGYADAICITTNLRTRENGNAICGKGIAKRATEVIPLFEYDLGKKIRADKSQLVYNVAKYKDTNIVALTSKDDWRDNSSLDLIEKSLQKLVNMTNEENWNTIFLPAAGCGCGGLHYTKDGVYGLYQKYLDERFFIFWRTLSEYQSVLTDINNGESVLANDR